MKGLSKIDRFEVLEPLADGSFGPVHLGREASTGRQVVIKLCTLPGQGLRQRFFTESEMAVKLRHPNIVEVVAAGMQGDVPYQVQELLPGEDLTKVIAERRPWRGTDKLRCLLQVARGLAYAHSQGVSHLDLKPDNVRLSGTAAKVMDFGTSRLASSETRSTQRGVTLATASYLPPEQVRSAPLDHRVDVFAFGALAYELFTYQRPFRGQTLSALVYQILYKEPVEARSVWPQCPPALSKMLSTCLAKNPQHRYAGFPQVVNVLEALHGAVEAGEHPAMDLAIAGQEVSIDPEDIMSQSLITRTAVKVSEPPPSMPDAATTQRLPQLQMEPPPVPPTVPQAEVSLPPSRGDSATVRIPALTPASPTPAVATAGRPAEPQRDSGAADPAGEDSESATIIMSKVDGPAPRSKVGATTRTSQPVVDQPTGPIANPPSSVANTAVRAATTARGANVGTQPTPQAAPPQAAPPQAAPPPPRPPVPKPPQATPPPPRPPVPKPPQAAPPPPRPPVPKPSPPGPPKTGPTMATPAAAVPGQLDLDRSPAPPAPTSTVAASGGRHALGLALGAVALVVVAVAAWWLMGRSSSEEAPAVAQIPRPQAASPGPEGSAPPTGRLQVDASPWGTITEITDGSGYLVELPAQPVTPLSLTLATGTYHIVVSRGPEAAPLAEGEPTSTDSADSSASGAPSEQSCEVEILQQGIAVCRVVFAPPTTIEYFKEVGWWQ